jgi:hypothetical protein
MTVYNHWRGKSTYGKQEWWMNPVTGKKELVWIAKAKAQVSVAGSCGEL